MFAAVNPTVQKFTSGSGTYTTPAGVQFIRARIIAGGGGGGGSGTTGTAGTGGIGGTSSFGTSLLSCVGGSGGGQADGGAGGTASLGTGPIGTALTGGRGGGNSTQSSSATVTVEGGFGGNGPLGGAGGGGSGATVTGLSGATNTGSGGGGAAAAGTNQVGGAGGGAGGWIEAIINAPATSYSYSVGASGTAGTAGTGGGAGGAGGSGYIEIIEYYTAVAVGTSTAVSANQVLAGPTSGSATTPSFRTLVNADLPAFVGVKYTGSTTTIGTTNTTLQFPTKVYDTGGTGSDYASGVYTVPSGQAGKYRITVVYFTGATTSSAANTGIQTLFQQNSNTVQGTYTFIWQVSSLSLNASASISNDFDCAVGDTLKVMAVRDSQVSSVSLTNTPVNYITIARIGT